MRFFKVNIFFPLFFVAANLATAWAITEYKQTKQTAGNSQTPQKDGEKNPGYDPDEYIPELDSPDWKPPEEESGVSQGNGENTNDPKDDDIHIKMYGGNTFSFGAGKSFFVSQKDRLSSDEQPLTPAFASGFSPSSDLKFNMTGNIGDYLSMNIDFDQKEVLSNNTIQIIYTPHDRKSLLKKMEIGNLEFGFGGSRLLNYNQDKYKGLGINTEFGIGKFRLKAMAAVSESQSETEVFEGRRRHRVMYFNEYRYVSYKYYQLEPFYYYDNLTTKPASLSAANYQRGNASALNIFTSQTPVYANRAINIDPGSLEIYLDSGDNKTNAIMQARPKYVGGNLTGNYYRLREGKDYSVNYKTGRLSFIKGLSVASRLYVRYTRNHGSTVTTDPSARIVNGKIETFIKYGSSLNEDALRNGVATFTGVDDVEIIPDGMVNLDIYEVRGVYDLQGTDIDQYGFSIDLFSPDDKQIPGLDTLGNYQVDFRQGLLQFGVREPFRNLQNGGSYYISDADLSAIYSEYKSVNVFDNSTVRLRTEFTASQRSLQLKHINIVPGSERVSVNGMILRPDAYYLDYQTGFFAFTNPDSPFVNDFSRVEIHYNYLPFGKLKENYLLGGRLEYQPIEEFTLGAGAYYNADFQPIEIQPVGSEPAGVFIAEGDANLNVTPKSMTALVNHVFKTDYNEVPVQVKAYGEYAHSFYNANTMGKALVDNMESSEIADEVNLNAGDWVLSSLPPSLGLTQCNRAPLYYRYYYNPANYSAGLLPYTSSPTASPPYSQVAGPYNVLYSHLSSNQVTNQNYQVWQSMVLDFDFSKAPDNLAPFVGVQNKIKDQPTDFSVYSEITFSVLLENGSGLGNGVALYLDIGALNEDTDGSGKMKTEDIGFDHIDGDSNGNGIQDAGENWDTGERNLLLDYDKQTGDTEDIGYSFNPPSCPLAATRVGAGPNISGYPNTAGNGVLNSEDSNNNGQLDTLDNVVNVSPANPAFQFASGSNVVLPGSWTQVKVYVNWSALTEREKFILRQSQSLRFYAVPIGAGNLGRGKLFVDQIRFSGSQWRSRKEKQFVSTETNLLNSSYFVVSNIDNFSAKQEYEANSFLLKERSEYESLYGKKTDIEIYTIKEGSLKLEYNFPATYEYVHVEKQLAAPMDISEYKKINVWVNHRQFSTTTAKLFFRIGNDASNYHQYEQTINRKGWQKLTFDLSRASKTAGKTDYKKIRYFALGVKNSITGAAQSGVTWVDDIYVSESVVQADYAYTYGTSLEITKPIFTTKNGVPVFTGTKVSFAKKFRNYNFHSINEPSPGFLQDQSTFQVASKILPFWVSEYTLDDFKSDQGRLAMQTDNYNSGASARTMQQTRQVFFSNMEYAPHITLAYSFSKDTISDAQPTITNGTLQNDRQSKKYLPQLEISQQLPSIAKIIKINYDIKASTTLLDSQDNIKVVESGGSQSSVQITKEQWEQSTESLRFSIFNFNLAATHLHSQQLLVEQNFSDTRVNTPFAGKFSMPFFSNPSDFRIRQRNNGVSLEVGYDHLWKFSPKLSFDLRYNEDSFRDNPLRFTANHWQEYKNSNSLTSFNFSLPLLLQGGRSGQEPQGGNPGVPGQSNFAGSDNITLSFRRDLKLEEFCVPFTRRTMPADDEFGINRVFPELIQRNFNLVQYPFWYYFLNPDHYPISFYNARNFVGRQSFDLGNAAVDYGNLYNNNLLLTEMVSLNGRFGISKGVTVFTDTRLSQNALRNNLNAAVYQEGDFTYSAQFLLNLMNLLNFWFWSHKDNNSFLTLGMTHDIHMFITSNVEENTISPDMSLQFKWLSMPQNILSGITLNFSVNIHSYREHQYLTDQGLDPFLSTQKDTIEYLYSIQKLINYKLSVEFFTEVPGLKKFFESVLHHHLEHNPRYSILLGMDLNRHEVQYINLMHAALLDEYLLKQSLDINLHRNVTGILDLYTVYDVKRQPDTNRVMQEVFSFQLGFSVKILF